MTLPFRLRLITGEGLGFLAQILRIPLYPVSWFYHLVMSIRNSLYNGGFLKTHRVDKPVISIGNLTLGGTGKTPFVAYVCGLLARKGLRQVVLARGYGSTDSLAKNDEALELGELGISVICNPDRVSAAHGAKESADVFVLDDGFQHRRIARDLDIVLIDATNPCLSSLVFPAGLLRESVYSLRRAHCAVIARSNLVGDVQQVIDHVRNIAPGIAIYVAHYSASNFVDSDGVSHHLDCAVNSRVVAFCGIGNPTQFYKSLTELGADIAATVTFQDHHSYEAADVARVEQAAIEANADMIITTAKDWMKYRTIDRTRKVFILQQNVKLIGDSGEFTTKLFEAAGAL